MKAHPLVSLQNLFGYITKIQAKKTGETISMSLNS